MKAILTICLILVSSQAYAGHPCCVRRVISPIVVVQPPKVNVVNRFVRLSVDESTDNSVQNALAQQWEMLTAAMPVTCAPPVTMSRFQFAQNMPEYVQPKATVIQAQAATRTVTRFKYANIRDVFTVHNGVVTDGGVDNINSQPSVSNY